MDNLSWQAPEEDNLPMGISRTDTGQLELYVPSCDDAIVTAVAWVPPLTEKRESFDAWSISLAQPSHASNQFEVGAAPPGYETTTEVGTALQRSEFASDFSQFLAQRESRDGVRLDDSFINIKLDRVPSEAIAYRADDDHIHTVSTAAASNENVDCD